MFNLLFSRNRHRYQHVARTVAQFSHCVFVEGLDFEHFGERNISDLFKAGKAFVDQYVGDFFVDVKAFNELLTQAGALALLLGSTLVGGHDVDLPASQFARKAHVTPASPDGQGQIVFVDHNVHRVLFFVDNDGTDVGRGQRADHKLGRVLAPEHNINALACQFTSDRLDA